MLVSFFFLFGFFFVRTCVGCVTGAVTTPVPLGSGTTWGRPSKRVCVMLRATDGRAARARCRDVERRVDKRHCGRWARRAPSRHAAGRKSPATRPQTGRLRPTGRPTPCGRRPVACPGVPPRRALSCGGPSAVGAAGTASPPGRAALPRRRGPAVERSESERCLRDGCAGRCGAFPDATDAQVLGLAVASTT